ncbi:solute carrier family 23 protein [Vibrio sp. PP-XX7]
MSLPGADWINGCRGWRTVLIRSLFAPLAGMIPAYATAETLLYVSILMLSGLIHIDWHDLTEAAPVVVTCLVMPLASSIAEGISMGFISYAVIKLFSGRAKAGIIEVYGLWRQFLL